MQRERLGAITERDRTFAWTVEHHEQVDAKGDESNSSDVVILTRRRLVGVVERESGEKQRRGEQRERGDEQVPTSERVDGIDRRYGEEEVDDTRTHGHEEGVGSGKAGFEEDTGGVVRNDIDTAD